MLWRSTVDAVDASMYANFFLLIRLVAGEQRFVYCFNHVLWPAGSCTTLQPPGFRTRKA